MDESGVSVSEDFSLVAHDGQRGFVDNMSISSVSTPLAASTVTRDPVRLNYLLFKNFLKSGYCFLCLTKMVGVGLFLHFWFHLYKTMKLLGA